MRVWYQSARRCFLLPVEMLQLRNLTIRMLPFNSLHIPMNVSGKMIATLGQDDSVHRIVPSFVNQDVPNVHI
jgi:hypothetical protein